MDEFYDFHWYWIVCCVWLSGLSLCFSVISMVARKLRNFEKKVIYIFLTVFGYQNDTMSSGSMEKNYLLVWKKVVYRKLFLCSCKVMGLWKR